MTLPSGEIWVERLYGRVNSQIYVDMLRTKVVPYLNLRIGKGKFKFQQDNCSVHASKFTKNYLQSAKIDVIDWSSYNSDLNIQENVWKMIMIRYTTTNNITRKVLVEEYRRGCGRRLLSFFVF